MVIDDNTATKYLNFGGNFDPNETASGFQVTPAIGATIVNEITFTTANDAPERDPIAFELYGSNDAIEGPYTLIASGYIMDFAGADAWPRFTKNATPITFENTTAYTHYQVLFTFLRDSSSANSMQIAEVELIGVPFVELPKATVYFEDFESYEAGAGLHGQNGWRGWQGAEGAGAPASDAFAFSGTKSVEVIGSADLVQVFAADGGVAEFSAMQYIPSGATGTTYFILMNQYDDPGTALDWSVQTNFDLGAGVVNFDGGATAQIVYDQWVEVKCVIDLDNNKVDLYYNGELIVTNDWDDTAHTTFQAVDLFGNGASSVYYDDITLKQ
jgi:hypothetical protein